MTIRIHISELLGKRKMTQKQLADLTDIRPATVSALYHETVKRIEVEQINRLCEVLECQPGDLMTFIPKEN
ncbi:hypothetical protein AB685_21890 [Bacillus sp. LL01]|uniref:helix-turn-helix domain-containing protein n=1 Tax=Bacillus sp. LL01 TaxID=1665556 RepID=UPI00064D3918|nr:helix-turn-helix transcriptional regulator [Bacillus sp. LL01]KMJ56441.1 hypothetical protein AB685_21890 [Bacillus sp. LL01]